MGWILKKKEKSKVLVVFKEFQTMVETNSRRKIKAI
jgi:hypothetical protein